MNKKIISGEPWVVNLRNDSEVEIKPVTSKWGKTPSMRFVTAKQEDPVMFIVDADGTHAIGRDGKPTEMKPDLTPCSCDEYRKQGIEEGWLDE